MMNKKGSIQDKIYVVAAIATVMVSFIALTFAWTITQPMLKDLGNEKTVDLMNKLDPASVINWFDMTVVMAYFGFNILACVVLPLKVENNPVLFGVIFIMMLLLVVVNAVFANAMINWIEGFEPRYTYTLFLLNNFVVAEAMFMLLMAFMLFFKSRRPEYYE